MANWKITDRFTCKGASGRIYEVIERRRVLTYSTLDGPLRAEGTGDLITVDGQDVNLLGDGSYQIVLTDEILVRI
ncbi:hypothetical protein ACQZ4X_13130 [Agrobacterium vitis]